MSKRNFSRFVSQKPRKLVATPNIIVNIDPTQNNYAATFNQQGALETFPLGHYYNFKALFDLEDKLKNTDYHLLSGSDEEFILMKELLKDPAFERAMSNYKKQSEDDVGSEGVSKIILKDSNDALIYAINDRKSRLNDDLIYLAWFSNPEFFGKLNDESTWVEKNIRKYNHDFYADTLFMLNAQLGKKFGRELYEIPFLERSAINKVDEVLEKNLAWFVLNKQSEKFGDLIKEDIEFNAGVMKDTFVEKSLNQLNKFYTKISDVSLTNLKLIDNHFNRILADYATSSLIRVETQEGILDAKRILEKRYSK
ncbi:hypothetical protein COV13_03050 [Candidatus Woesearchaeota archaeon CG10_big_fil_rev_8_21_14_0_10_32_9]|nr:MAG: hypothetical protein COV13_03050 [Candidatus Woesearchaeota archaeon CG10_big_fil_rev_8_21_14_0_10_32_9]